MLHVHVGRVDGECPAALSLIRLASQRAANREASLLVDSILRALEVHVFSLREVAGQYSYPPLQVAKHPDVLADLASLQDAMAGRPANRCIERVNRLAGSDDLYLADPQGLTLASTNWARPHCSAEE